ncbi:glycosyltransferase [Methyloligella solikamskensis]|uniref:Glycosyltransferase n=1 Tax=Methyloligella solikamskensis TaxID=1177756 RepID=A0ABW3J717_9HYPH
MEVLIITYGSRGDVQPYVALGRGLQDAGHEVMLATSVRFEEFVESNGLAYGYLNDDLLSIIDTDQGKELIEKAGNLYEIAKRTYTMARQVAPLQKQLMRESWEVAKTFQPDFIVFHSKGGAAPHIAEKLGIGCALATPIPMFVPTGAWRFVVAPDWNLGAWYNRASYRLIHLLVNRVWRKYVRSFRAGLDLPPIAEFDFLKEADGTPIPIIHAHSEAVLPRPDDWPDYAYITGYWFLDGPNDWEPPQTLTDFLEAGPPPVYVGFGSMAGRDPKRMAEIVVEALQRVGLRGIIATGWGGLSADDLPETILKIDEAPHEWLFPKMAAVVHHGGAGTTAAGLRAGKPSVLVPFFADQPFWASRVYALGAGPKAIPRKRLTVDKLAAALKEATTNQDIIDKAASLGAEIRKEHGVANAVGLIERLAKVSELS